MNGEQRNISEQANSNPSMKQSYWFANEDMFLDKVRRHQEDEMSLRDFDDLFERRYSYNVHTFRHDCFHKCKTKNEKINLVLAEIKMYYRYIDTCDKSRVKNRNSNFPVENFDKICDSAIRYLKAFIDGFIAHEYNAYLKDKPVTLSLRKYAEQHMAFEEAAVDVYSKEKHSDSVKSFPDSGIKVSTIIDMDNITGKRIPVAKEKLESLEMDFLKLAPGIYSIEDVRHWLCTGFEGFNSVSVKPQLQLSTDIGILIRFVREIYLKYGASNRKRMGLYRNLIIERIKLDIKKAPDHIKGHFAEARPVNYPDTLQIFKEKHYKG